MRILIYGGTGYIGNKLAAHLIKQGNTVGNVSRSRSALKHIHNFKTETQLLSAISEFKPNKIIYLAACFDNNVPEEIVTINITMPLKILHTIEKVNGIEFIYTSTYWLLGNNDLQVPIDLYSTAKKSMSEFLIFYNTYTTVNCKEVLLYGVYGDRPGKLLDDLIDCAKSNHSIELTEGKQKLNLVHIYDVCIAITSIIDASNNNKFSVQSSHEYSPREIVEIINQHASLTPLWGTKSYRTVELMTPCYSDAYQKIIIEDTLPDYIKIKLA